jgi:hypothetical protein
MTQFHGSNFGNGTASTSTSTTTLEVKVNKEVVDHYPTYANYSKILHDQKVVINNNLIAGINMIMACFDMLEGKRTDYVYLSVEELAKQPQYDMPYNYYENQGLYAVDNKAKLASSTFEINRVNLCGASTYMPMTTYL